MSKSTFTAANKEAKSSEVLFHKGQKKVDYFYAWNL